MTPLFTGIDDSIITTTDFIDDFINDFITDMTIITTDTTTDNVNKTTTNINVFN